MSNSNKPPFDDDGSLSFEEQVAQHRSRFAEAKTIQSNSDIKTDTPRQPDVWRVESPRKVDFSRLKRTKTDANTNIELEKVVAQDDDKANNVGGLYVEYDLDFSKELEAISQTLTDKEYQWQQDLDKGLPKYANSTPISESGSTPNTATTPAYIKTDPTVQRSLHRLENNQVITLSNKNLTSRQIGVMMAVSLLLVSWLKQDRLADYWQQSYQTGQPWTTLTNIGGWQVGEQVGHLLSVEKLNAGLSNVGTHSEHWLNHTFFAKQILAQEQAKQQAVQSQEVQQMEVIPASSTQVQPQTQAVKTNQPLTHISLKVGQKVLFAGDSMMQGVAPWVMRKLKHEYQIDSLDLSKQSTGLSYSSFFDWPATIEKTLAEQGDIKALIIYLGANDPWAVPNPISKSAKYIDFATDEWVVLYHQKMERILNNAKSHGVQVIWITPPTMKKPKLNEQMLVLTDIMHKGIDNAQVVIMDSKPLLSPSDEYTDSIMIEGKTVKVRTADGIHFTTDGQKHLANHILQRIKIEP